MIKSWTINFVFEYVRLFYIMPTSRKAETGYYIFPYWPSHTQNIKANEKLCHALVWHTWGFILRQFKWSLNEVGVILQ